MNKYKVAVYAICKNEESFVNRWYESMKEADAIYVLDTGSTDNTVSKLKSLDIIVDEKIITPWRFDVARNEALNLVPKDYDICVCTDLDEVLNKGWREQLEKIWNKKTNRLQYIYNWSLDKNNKPIVSFYYEKIHCRNGYKWIYPVHEVLEYNNDIEIKTRTNNIILNHYPDNKKSRSNYLSLLELSIEENPNSDRNMHYLGREYMYHKKWNECINTLKKHLNLKTSSWKEERSASMRFIARAYQNLNLYDEAETWLNKAIEETPYLRDPYVEKALLKYQLEQWNEVEKLCLKALKITCQKRLYINEIFSWDHTIDDLLSLCCFYKKDYNKAIEHINAALIYSPDNKRLLSNKKIIEKFTNNRGI